MKRFTKEEREKAVRMVESGKTISEAAKEIGGSANTVRRWIIPGIQQTDTQISKDGKYEAGFIPVTLSDIKAEMSKMEIVTPNGYTIRIEANGIEAISEILGVIREC